MKFGRKTDYDKPSPKNQKAGPTPVPKMAAAAAIFKNARLLYLSHLAFDSADIRYTKK